MSVPQEDTLTFGELVIMVFLGSLCKEKNESWGQMQSTEEGAWL